MNSNEKHDPRDEMEKISVPIAEEQVEVAKRVVEGRTVTVRTTPITERHTIAEPVTREWVTVERVPIGEIVDAVPGVREEGNLTVIPVVEERIRIVKELVLTEEIHLRRTCEDAIHEQTVELTRTEVTIED